MVGRLVACRLLSRADRQVTTANATRLTTAELMPMRGKYTYHRDIGVCYRARKSCMFKQVFQTITELI